MTREQQILQLLQWPPGTNLAAKLAGMGTMGALLSQSIGQTGGRAPSARQIADAIRQLARQRGTRAAPPVRRPPQRQKPNLPPPKPVRGAGGGPSQIQMHRVSSSNVYAIGYHAQTQTLAVRYQAPVIGKQNGQYKIVAKANKPGPLYYYSGVPKRLWDSFASAGSKGTWVWDNLRIRGSIAGHQYDYRLVAGSLAPDGERIMYVPRKATEAGYNPRQITQGGLRVGSALPGTGDFRGETVALTESTGVNRRPGRRPRRRR